MSKIYTISALILIAILALVTYSFSKSSNTNTQTSNLNTNSLSNNMMMNNPSMMGGNSMMMGMMNMSDSVKDDQSFLENMIPHHQEAVDSSNLVLNSTTDPELKTFVQNVISAQTKEIGEMKTWYKTWFNKDYTPNSNYQAMMGGMKGKTGIELDQAYVQGMTMHHQGAIQMATKIQTLTKRPELLKLANDIIVSQTAERTTLMNWMMSKYNNSMMGR
jgi:uncharacterized protein (DUF305 family)